jgi:putative acetyltransferase
MRLNVRRAELGDRPRMVDLWERAVRATHSFLDEAAIAGLRPAVAEVVAADTIQWWVADAGHVVAGFLGFSNGSVEALFVDPACHRQGLGRALIAHARHLNHGAALSVDVNEANLGAVAFYRRLGFDVVGRSPTDGEGRPFPLLHMMETATTSARLDDRRPRFIAHGYPTSAEQDMETLAILAVLEAKPGREKDVEQFLASALPLAQAEQQTVRWYALKLGPSSFGIFDTFADQAGRDAHLSGEIAKALFAKADELLAGPPQIQQPQIIAAK